MQQYQKYLVIATNSTTINVLTIRPVLIHILTAALKLPTNNALVNIPLGSSPVVNDTSTSNNINNNYYSTLQD